MKAGAARVFISHIHQDDELAIQLRSLLATAGRPIAFSIILAKTGGERLHDDEVRYSLLAPRIRWASTLVVLLTEATCESDWVRWEIAYANERRKRILGVWAPGHRRVAKPQCLQGVESELVGWDQDGIWNLLSGQG